MSYILWTIYGAVFGFGYLMGHLYFSRRRKRDNSANRVNQSNNVAGGDIVGRDKYTRR